MAYHAWNDLQTQTYPIIIIFEWWAMIFKGILSLELITYVVSLISNLEMSKLTLGLNERSTNIQK